MLNIKLRSIFSVLISCGRLSGLEKDNGTNEQFYGEKF